MGFRLRVGRHDAAPTRKRRAGGAHGRRLPKALPRPLWDRILDAASQNRREGYLAVRDRAIIALMFASGLRCFELVALNVEDLNFSRRCVHVWHGKGDKERVPAVAKLGLDAVAAYLPVRPECTLEELDPDQQRLIKRRPLFVSRKGGRLDTSAVRRIFGRVEKLLHAEGVAEKIHPHATRHSHITETARKAIASGKTLFDVAEQAGHAKLDTTRLYYAALAEDRQSLVDDL